jgi:4-amino-4-deoxy-L-arabinose transferase-like glycosyltransferase
MTMVTHNSMRLLLVLLSGFAVRVAWWLYSAPAPVSDFEVYRLLAEGLLETGQFGTPDATAYRFPGYPSFLALIMTISHSKAWLSFVNVVLSTGLIYLVYQAAIQLTSQRSVALIAATICAFNPTYIYLSPILASEHLSTLLLCSSFLVSGTTQFCKTAASAISRQLMSGVLFGAAVLTRGDCLFFLPVLLGVSYFASHGAEAWMSLSKRVTSSLHMVLTLLVVVLTVAPWYARNYYTLGPGAGISTSGGVNFYFAHNAKTYGGQSLKETPLKKLAEVQRNDAGYQLGLRHLSEAGIVQIAEDAARGTKRLFLSSGAYSVEYNVQKARRATHRPSRRTLPRGARWFKATTLLYFFLLAAALFSVLGIRRIPIRAWMVLYSIVFMNWVGNALAFWAKARYRFVSEVAFCILASFVVLHLARHGTTYLSSRFGRHRGG